MDTGGHVVASVAAEPAPPVVSVVAIEEADPLLSEAYPVSLVEISGTHALDLKDINLPATVNDADGEGNCVVSFTVPAKYRHGTSLYLPVSLSPSFAPVSTALVTDTSSSDTEVQGVDDADAAAATGENMIRLLRTANGIHTLDMPGFQAVGYLPPPVQASPVSVLTEPLSHSVGPGRSLSFTNVLGENKDPSKSLSCIETPVLRCTAQPLFIPNSRQSSTTAWRSSSSVVNSTEQSGCISVLSTPSLGTLLMPYQNPSSPCSGGSRPSPRPHICQHCNESLPTATSLFHHMESVHGDKPKNLFTCEKCGASFFRRYRYHEHVHAYHTGDGDRQFTCAFPGCGKKYRYRRHLRRHSRCHGDVSEFRRFECEICGKRFPRVSQRDEHRNIHTGEKPFMCDICGAAYSHSSTLWLHRKRHESGKIDSAGNPIPGSAKHDDGINVLNTSSLNSSGLSSSNDVSWQEGSMDGSLAEMSTTETIIDASTAAAALDGTENTQSVIIQTESLDNSAQVLVALTEANV